MADVNDRAYDTDLLDALSKRVMVREGANGTRLQAAVLSLHDFEACADAVESKYVRLQSR